MATTEHPPLQSLWISVLVAGLTVAGLIGPLAALAAVAFAAQPGSTVSVPVRLAEQPALLPQAVTPLVAEGAAVPLGDSWRLLADGGLQAEVATLEGDRPDLVVIALAHGGALATGFAVAALVALLVPLVRTTAHREPFAPGHARRLALAALVLVLAAVLATVLPHRAAVRVLESSSAPPGWWVADVQPVLWPLPAAVLVGVLALVVHGGHRLRRDAEGLV